MGQPYLGKAKEPEGKYVVRCIRCESTESLVMIPHKNLEDSLVGWLFSCQKCAPHLYGAEVTVAHDEVEEKPDAAAD